jgi:DNA-binding MurR/RpiR family transcriptional regulator
LGFLLAEISEILFKSIEVASDSGAYTVAITGGIGSRIVSVSTETVYVAQGGHETGIPLLQPRVCQLAVIQLLLEKSIRLRDGTMQTLEKVDRTLDKKRLHLSLLEGVSFCIR